MEKVQNYKNVELAKDKLDTIQLPKIRNEFIAKLENALMFLSYKDLSMWHSEAKNKVHLNHFDGAWLVDVSLKHEEEDGFALIPFGEYQVTPEMFPNLNLKTFNLSGDVGHLSRYKFLDLKQKRHLDSYRYIFSQKFAFLDYGKQQWWTNEDGYGFDKMIKDGKGLNAVFPVPVSLKSGYYIDRKQALQHAVKGLEEKDSFFIHTLKGINMALQLSLTYDYEWSCYIKEKPDSLGIRIPIHPSSSKEIFMLRNVPEGNKRKKAIVNFVKEHYRTIKGYDDSERKVLIKKHLRGDLKFNWRGLEVHIIPSPYDLRMVKSTKKFLDV